MNKQELIDYSNPQYIKYKGYRINCKCGMYWALGRGWHTLKAVKKEIDKCESQTSPSNEQDS